MVLDSRVAELHPPQPTGLVMLVIGAESSTLGLALLVTPHMLRHSVVSRS